MTAVNPMTDAVAVGANAAAAYRNLMANGTGSSVPGNDTQALLTGISGLASSMKLTLVNATTVSPAVWINEGTLHVGTAGLDRTLADVSAFLRTYSPNSTGTVYKWTDSTNGLNIGVIQLRSGVTELYYITIR
jgi:hypothetical protein